jgi:hypothetical protein
MNQDQYTREKELTEKLKRVKAKHSNLDISDVKEVRLMFGSIQMVIVCDDIYPIAEIKKEYMRRLKYRAIELENELLQLKQ